MAILLAGGLSMVAVSPALASGTAWADAPVLPDPSLANGPVIPASAATAGTAMVSVAADGPVENCSSHNPCAMPTPALDHVAVVSGTAIGPSRHAAGARSKPVITVAPDPRGKPES